MKVIRIVLLSMILALIVAGCQDKAPDPGETVTFPQSVTSLDGSLSVGYPEGWIAEAGDRQVIMANSAEARAVTDLRTLTADQIFGIVNVIPNRDLNGLGLTEESTAREFLDAILSRGSGAARTETDVNNRREFRTGGHDAVIARGTVNNDGARYGSILALIRFDGSIVLLNFNTSEDAAESYMDTIESITRSVVFPAPAQ